MFSPERGREQRCERANKGGHGTYEEENKEKQLFLIFGFTHKYVWILWSTKKIEKSLGCNVCILNAYSYHDGFYCPTHV